tara:strand:+ start:729 stop:1637 length:909 start_codon:yes stop_codon:yes gene_type:complete
VKNKRIGVWGWWQGRNLGDNWILLSMKKAFGEDIIPIDTSVRNFITPNRFDFVICGGGGLFVSDVHKPWNCKNISVPYGIFGMGTEFGADLSEIDYLNTNSRFFYVRDRMTCEKFNLNKEINLSADVTFIDPIRISENDKGNDILFIWRKNNLHKLLRKKIWVDYIGKYNTREEWLDVVSSFGRNIREHSFDTESNEIESFMSNIGCVISQRYHGVVAAIQTGTPCIAIDICPKINSIMKDCGLSEYCIKIGDISKLSLLYKKCMNSREDIRGKMENFTEVNRKLVISTSEIAKQSIKDSIC